MIVSDENLSLFHGDALDVLRTLNAGMFRCCVTSPPYFRQRDYGVEDQIGQEDTPEEFIERLVEVFREVRRVLTDDGTLWVNLGDSRSASSLLLIPARVALGLKADGWFLRSEVVWQKLNPLPESVINRFSSSHEFVFVFAKAETYYFDVEAVKEPIAESSLKDKRRRTERVRDYQNAAAVFGEGTSTFTKGKTGETQKAAQTEDSRKNSSSDHRVVGFQDRWNSGDKPELRRKRDVWSLASEPYKGAHYAPMPTKLVEPCILAGSAPGDIVLDPFCGSGTVGVVALRHDRNFVGIDLNSEYLKQSLERITSAQEKVA